MTYCSRTHVFIWSTMELESYFVLATWAGKKYDAGLQELEEKRVVEQWSDNKSKKQLLDLGLK